MELMIGKISIILPSVYLIQLHFYEHLLLKDIFTMFRKSVAQVIKNAGEPYRPKEWYSPKNCERQFKILISNVNKEIRSLPFMDMMQNIAEGLRNGKHV